MSDLMICLVVLMGAIVVFILLPILISKLFVLLWGKSKEEPVYKSSEQILEESRAFMADTTTPPLHTDDKPASATKRAVVGTIIGGVPGAIIGVASAIDKNNKANQDK